MNGLNIKECAAKNFLCFGPKGIRFKFNEYGNIVLISGTNLDIDPNNEEERKASNGTGKSSVVEIIIYTLFGKTIKHPSKVSQEKKVINNQSKKKLETEVLIDDYKIVRKRKPDSLQIWKSKDGIWNDDTELSLGGMPATEKFIEDLIGYTYETFVNILVFTDNNMGSFLECNGPKKREIVENMLSLDIYRTYNENAKKLRNMAKETIKDRHRSFELVTAEYESSKKRIKTVEDQKKIWKESKKNELDALINKISIKQAELNSTDIGPALAQYQEAQTSIAAYQSDLPIKEDKLTAFREGLEEARRKFDILKASKNETSSVINQINTDIVQSNSVIRSNNQMLTDAEAQKCQNCNFIDTAAVDRCNKIIARETDVLATLKEKQILEKDKLAKYDEDITKLNEMLKIGETKARELINDIDAIRKKIITLAKVEKPEATAKEKVLEEQLQELNNQLLSKKNEINGPSPFIKILDTTIEECKARQKDCESKKLELDEANDELPYYEFWVKAFGENGIRKFIIDGIIPALNTRVAHWLEFLIDSKIKLEFDNQLQEKIERNPSDGDDFVYYAMSGGERRRLNLAVSQAFAHIMMLNSGYYPSLVFLDEVTTNIDPIGVQGVYNMIIELAKERQVFITTHDHDLLEMLNGCETINLVKKGGFTTIKN